MISKYELGKAYHRLQASRPPNPHRRRRSLPHRQLVEVASHQVSCSKLWTLLIKRPLDLKVLMLIIIYSLLLIIKSIVYR